MTIRSTFALDPATETRILRLARLWNVSKAEVIRRSVAEAEKNVVEEVVLSPLQALDWLQSHGTLTEAEVVRWNQDSREGWEEAWEKSQTSPTAAEGNPS
jgi:hypothetical protein